LILLQFNIRNPWGNDFKNVRCWSGRLPARYKHWEFEILKSTDVVSFLFEITHRQNHAGLNFELALLGYGIHFMIYDNRHWDFANNKWERCTDSKN
jgi:hypothetical protein